MFTKIKKYLFLMTIVIIGSVYAENLPHTEYLYSGPGATKLTAIRSLMDAAAAGTNSEVVYILSGDSTRDSYNAGQEYIYSKHLAQINVHYVHNAKSGLRAFQWVNNKVPSASLSKALENSKGAGENTIMEFSLGINDLNGYGAEKAQQNVIESISAYLKAKPKAHLFLVVPVSHKTNFQKKWLPFYLEVAKKFDLPLLNQERVLNVAFNDKHDRFYYDNTHPNFFGAMRLTKYILDAVSGPVALSKFKWQQDFFSGSKNESSDVNLAKDKKIIAKSWYWPHNESPTLPGGKAMKHPVFSRIEPFAIKGDSLVEISGVKLYRVSMIDADNHLVYSFANTLWKNHKLHYVYVPQEIVELRITIASGDTPVIKYLTSGALAKLDNKLIYYQQPK
jgi:hypothetical protein